MTLKEARIQLVSMHYHAHCKVADGDKSASKDMEAAQFALDMLPDETAMQCYETQMDELVTLSKSDPEAAHSEADKLLCKLLSRHGYDSIVEAYKQIDAWYA